MSGTFPCMPDDRPVDPVVRELLTHILGEFEAAVGAHVLGYLFASEKPVDELLDEAEPGVLATLANLYVSTEELPDAESRRTYLRAMLFRTDDDGATLARHLRLASGGRDEVAQADDSASRALIAIAVDAYPAFLLPPNPLLPPEIPPFMREPVEVMIGVLRHPQTGAYAHAVRDDGQLAEM